MRRRLPIGEQPLSIDLEPTCRCPSIGFLSTRIWKALAECICSSTSPGAWTFKCCSETQHALGLSVAQPETSGVTLVLLCLMLAIQTPSHWSFSCRVLGAFPQAICRLGRCCGSGASDETDVGHDGARRSCRLVGQLALAPSVQAPVPPPRIQRLSNMMANIGCRIFAKEDGELGCTLPGWRGPVSETVCFCFTTRIRF